MEKPDQRREWMVYELPHLPYGYDALEPYIEEQTIRLHHEKHRNTYVINLNNVPEDVRTAVHNNGGGHSNHSMHRKE